MKVTQESIRLVPIAAYTTVRLYEMDPICWHNLAMNWGRIGDGPLIRAPA